MHFPSAIVLAVITVLASPISAMPATSNYTVAAKCTFKFCFSDSQCKNRPCVYDKCVRISIFLEIDNMTYLYGRALLSA
ncbi:uncharacterized protein EDB93DRAFT_1123365 [Suillus bovinus]|uniref:uncharacterized protein n=1 Tax=Suillus bovinus TaxID=48563 RepID=UPI001B861697|nr:uncharacterized protein EDB93DRAFT_1123365 [Suillus bovinus]KAG2158167.1 hypothetical protein EDB93DRAFT_1123365 [Suillus bovinus]